MDLTVGKIEDMLRKYPKETTVSLTCGVCHCGSIGGEDILKITDKTDETYGYIELESNAKSEGNVKVTKDEKKFYEAEITRLKEKNKTLESKIEKYKDCLKSIDDKVNTSYKIIAHMFK